MQNTPIRHSPKRESKRETLICVVLLFLALLSFFLASVLPASRALGQLLAVIFLVFFVQLSSRYLFCSYEYELCGDRFRLDLIQGKRKKPLGTVVLDERAHLFTQEEWKREKGRFRLGHRLSCTANLKSRSIRLLLMPEESGAWLLLSFEPSDEMLVAIEKLIKKQESETP